MLRAGRRLSVRKSKGLRLKKERWEKYAQLWIERGATRDESMNGVERGGEWGQQKNKTDWIADCIYLPRATKTSSNCRASVTLVHLIRMWSGSVFSGSWWNLQGSVMEPPRCVTTLPGAVCTITAPVSSSVGGRRRNILFSVGDQSN